MNLHEASEAIAAILDQIPGAQLPRPSRTEPDAKYGTCHWFGGHGYYVGATTSGDDQPVRGTQRRAGMSSLFELEYMQRLENQFWDDKDGAA